MLHRSFWSLWFALMMMACSPNLNVHTNNKSSSAPPSALPEPEAVITFDELRIVLAQEQMGLPGFRRAVLYAA